MWEKNIYTIRKSAGKYPQESYVMVLLVIQTRHKEYRRRVCGIGEDYLGNIFASTFLRKVKNSLAHCRNSNYNIDKKN